MLMVYFLTPAIFMKRILSGMGVSEEKASELTREAVEKNLKDVIRVRDAQEKPMVGFTYRNLKEQLTEGLMEAGIPVYPEPDRAARALQACLTYAGYRKRGFQVSGVMCQESKGSNI
jgi:acyl-CoA synthetase (NDP forming)